MVYVFHILNHYKNLEKKRIWGLSVLPKLTTLRKNQFPQLREYTELSGTSEVESENKEERDRERERERK